MDFFFVHLVTAQDYNGKITGIIWQIARGLNTCDPFHTCVTLNQVFHSQRLKRTLAASIERDRLNPARRSLHFKACMPWNMSSQTVGVDILKRLWPLWDTQVKKSREHCVLTPAWRALAKTMAGDTHVLPQATAWAVQKVTSTCPEPPSLYASQGLRNIVWVASPQEGKLFRFGLWSIRRKGGL